MKICLYGASSDEINKVYLDVTYTLGEEMAKRGHTLVFGGGATGLMGAAARGMTSQNGEIIGVAPEFFNVDGILYDKCTDFIYTENMRERKFIMEDTSDAFIVTPGGIGTFEEFFEVLTLKQLGRHNKPIVLFNINGYFDSVNALLNNAVEEKFMRESCRDLLKSFTDIGEMLSYIENYDGSQMSVEQMKFIK